MFRVYLLLLSSLFIVYSTVHFVKTNFIPSSVHNSIVKPCSIEDCVKSELCNYYSPQNGSYCFYGWYTSFTYDYDNAVIAYVKTNLTSCSAEPQLTQVHQFFRGCPCNLQNGTTSFCPIFSPSPAGIHFHLSYRTASQPTTDPICSIYFTGCMQYRLFYYSSATVCEQNGVPKSSSEPHGLLYCFGGPYFVDVQNTSYIAIDCQS